MYEVDRVLPCNGFLVRGKRSKFGRDVHGSRFAMVPLCLRSAWFDRQHRVIGDGYGEDHCENGRLGCIFENGTTQGFCDDRVASKM